jgi:hypothetical protein
VTLSLGVVFLQLLANGADARRAWGAEHCAVATHWERVMGKYVLAWILGVPAVVLVAVYAFTHLL